MDVTVNDDFFDYKGFREGRTVAIRRSMTILQIVLALCRPEPPMNSL